VGKINIPRIVEVLRQEFLESSDGGLERVTFSESEILNDLLSPIKSSPKTLPGLTKFLTFKFFTEIVCLGFLISIPSSTKFWSSEIRSP
jgi:hypothetical protein